MKKTTALLLALAVILCFTIGGTIAWLTATTGPVTNTFTIGDINIDIKEHKPDDDFDALTKTEAGEITTFDYNTFVPGDTLLKDPFVRIDNTSEDSYIFICVEEKNNTFTVKVDDQDVTKPILTYGINSVWTEFKPDTAVDGCKYYVRTFDATSKNDDDINYKDGQTEWYILTENADNNGYVTVSSEITKEMVDAITANKPQLVFRAAAIQKDNIANETAAWAELPAAFKAPTT